jgi:hypothetical protein
MEKDAHFERRRSEVADELHSVSRENLFRRFVLDYHPIVDDHVESLPSRMPPLVPDIDHQLANDYVAPIAELMLEGAGINTLAQAVAVVVVHVKKTADNGTDSLSLE